MAQTQQTSNVLVKSQKLTITSTAAVLSSAFTNEQVIMRFAPTVDCWYATGSSTVTASSTGASGSHLLFGGIPEYINKNAKHNYISIISNGASGEICISEAT